MFANGWFFREGKKQGIFWAIMIYLVGAINDVLMKFLGDRLHTIEIVFFRFLFSGIAVLIPMFYSKTNLFKSAIHSWHFLRGALGAISLTFCCFSVNTMPLAENTIILFSETLFMLPLAIIFLKEKIGGKVFLATAIGFLGLIVMFKPNADNINIIAIIPTLAAAIFAVMNIMIKKMVDSKEHTLTMLFYFGLYTTILSGFVVPFYWTTPNLSELVLILLLGVGANLIQFFIFLAYKATTASNVNPVRYVELPFAILFGFIFFGQVPETTALFGSFLIIFGTLLLSGSTKPK
ncbi:MAG: DMT family transporter [Holosporales bacterium]|jgi:S-adenosylmethionine uptake transporter|nr:DMT family transporter [Holosporales bacterium]